jgi:carbonic anhydrase
VFRKLIAFVFVAAMPAMAAAAWQTISSDQGKRVEIDRSSIKKDASGKVEAWGRIVLDKPINDPKTSTSYRIIEALSRYDCIARSYSTLKRSYFKEEGELLRQEEPKAPLDMPVRSGTLDDKLLREVCRPKPGAEATAAASKMAEKVNEAASELRKANEKILQKETKVAPLALPPPPPPPAAKPEPKAEPKVEVKPKLLPEFKPKPLPEAKPEIKPESKSESKPKPAPVPPAAKPELPVPVQQARAPVAPRPRIVKPSPVVEHSPEPYAHAHIHWAYEGEGGPDNWSKLQSDYASCASGQRQSPIDIRDGIRVDLEPIKFSYRSSQFRIVDNGHTVQVAVGGSSLSLLGKPYQLVQFHFHRPSEERVNGKSFEMVIHFVHKSEDGKLAVLALLLDKGKEHPVIQTIWNHLPLEKNEEVIPPGVSIDVAQLLPENRNYYTYMGSLTTPPCSEGVLWLVLKQAQSISAEQLAIFAKLYNNNARPIQPSNSRLIKESR